MLRVVVSNFVATPFEQPLFLLCQGPTVLLQTRGLVNLSSYVLFYFQDVDVLLHRLHGYHQNMLKILVSLTVVTSKPFSVEQSKIFYRELLDQVVSVERQIISKGNQNVDKVNNAKIANIEPETRRVGNMLRITFEILTLLGLLARKIGMLPQWTVTGERMLCTLLEVTEVSKLL